MVYFLDRSVAFAEVLSCLIALIVLLCRRAFVDGLACVLRRQRKASGRARASAKARAFDIASASRRAVASRRTGACNHEDHGPWILDFGSWTLDLAVARGSWLMGILDLGSSALDLGPWISPYLEGLLAVLEDPGPVFGTLVRFSNP